MQKMERHAQTVIESFQIRIVLTYLLIHALKLVVVHTMTPKFLMRTLRWYISSRYTIISVIIAIRLSHRKVIYWSTRDPTISFPQTIVWFVNKNFATTDELAIHMKEEHSQVCGICEETFATRSKLVKPVQSNMKMIIIEFSVISIVPNFQQ